MESTKREHHWFACRKRPVIVGYRVPLIGGEYIETREGKLFADHTQDYIIKGVEGEEYPIKRDIFYKTYRVMDNTQVNRFPIVIEDEGILAMIKEARSLEWVGQHWLRKYKTKMDEIFELIRMLHDIPDHITWTLASEIPTIYYVGEIVTEYDVVEQTEEIDKEIQDTQAR